jgi:hypothetical protein
VRLTVRFARLGMDRDVPALYHIHDYACCALDVGIYIVDEKTIVFSSDLKSSEQ